MLQVDNKRLYKELWRYFLITFTCILVVAPLLSSCFRDKINQVSPSGAMVQIWVPVQGENSATLLSFGISVSNGHQILTFIDYENYTPDGNLEVRHNDETYLASIKSIDPRTGITLIELDGSKRLPTAKMSDTDLPKAGNLFISGWVGPDYAVLEETKANISTTPEPSPYFFNLYTDNTVINFREGSVVSDGTEVFGLLTTYRSSLVLVLRLGPMGVIPPIAMIKSGKELLSADVTKQIWAKGPAVSTLVYNSTLNGYISGMLTNETDYENMTVALLDLFGTIGEQMDTTELGLDFTQPFWYRAIDGIMLVAVYPYPVDLKNYDGVTLTQAKWVAMVLDRDENKPNYLVYGAKPYDVQGGYYLNGDVTDLENAIF